MALPIFQTNIRELSMMETQWASQINPLLSLPNNKPSFVTEIELSTGNNVINHMLGRKPIGWIIIDVDQVVSIYRSAAFNDLTLTLNSSGSAVISLMVI